MFRFARRYACRHATVLSCAIVCAIIVFLWSWPVDSALAHSLYYLYARFRISFSGWSRPSRSPDILHTDANRSLALDYKTGPSFSIGVPTALIGDYATLNSSRGSCLTYGSRYHMLQDVSASHRWRGPTRDKQTTQTAIILRAWSGFVWTDDDTRNVQAMIAEMSHLGEEYAVFVLLHLREDVKQADGLYGDVEDLKLRYIPSYFQNITETWTYDECQKSYPAVEEYEYVVWTLSRSPSRSHSHHSFYFHAFMGLQLFAEKHPEFDFFWNWEMDTRYTGFYSHLFPSLSEWAAARTDNNLWEYNTRFYIPSVHGTYEEFQRLIAASNVHIPQPSPWVDLSNDPSSPLPGNEADLITLFPIFDTSYTIWPWKDYLVHYQLLEVTPRFASVGTNIRLSRRMLDLMIFENKAGRGIMSEMWPPTLAYHHRLKAVYVPHPMYLDKKAPADTLQDIFNGGKGGSVGGSWGSVINQDRAFLGSTWYWNAELPLRLYSLWKDSFAEPRNDLMTENVRSDLCLPPMLLHPIKGEKL